MKYKEPLSMKEIHNIRIKLHNERKGLSVEEIIARTNKRAKEAIAKYGLDIRIISSAKDIVSSR